MDLIRLFIISSRKKEFSSVQGVQYNKDNHFVVLTV